MCFDCLTISHHESTNATYLFDGSVKPFNSPMDIMNCHKFASSTERRKLTYDFKTAKYQFGLVSFGQQTLLGVYRWLILSLISFVLTHCWAGDPPSRVYLSLRPGNLPDWQEATLLTLQQLLPKTAISLLLIEIESKRELLASQRLTLELVSL